MKTSQNRWVAEQLKEKGFVTRNEALKCHITRLASRINDLKKVGFSLEGKHEGKDYVYYTSS